MEVLKSQMERFAKIILAFNYFCKIFHLKSSKCSEHVADLKYVRVSNIPGLSMCQGFEFSGYRGFTYFRKYDRVLHMQGLHKVLNIPEYG